MGTSVYVSVRSCLRVDPVPCPPSPPSCRALRHLRYFRPTMGAAVASAEASLRDATRFWEQVHDPEDVAFFWTKPPQVARS